MGAISDRLTVPMKARSGRLVSLWKPEGRPQFVGTDLHLTGGAAELSELKWDGAAGRLSGALRRAPGIEGHVFVHLPKGWVAIKGSGAFEAQGEEVVALQIKFDEARAKWWLECGKK